MPFKLSPPFLTGIDHLDDDHRSLVAQINALEELEQTKDKQRLLTELARLMADLTDHFSAEGANLKALKYPELDSHAKHHAETVVTLKQLMVDLDKSDPINSNVTSRPKRSLRSR
jgi:hemerythrin-like metal-binding protein